MFTSLLQSPEISDTVTLTLCHLLNHPMMRERETERGGRGEEGERERGTDGQTDEQTNIRTCRQIYKLTETERERQRDGKRG